MRIAVVGGGVTGLTVAGELQDRGHDLAVYEAGRPGGLAGGFRSGLRDGVYIDKYYHHIFGSDADIIDIIDNHGLKADLSWYASRPGLLAQGRAWPFGRPMDLLRCRPVGSLFQRAVMGLNLLLLKGVRDPSSLDTVTCEEFFRRRGNLPAYRGLWEPLLRQKFGSAWREIPAAFLWGRVAPRIQSREKNQETLGYLRGGFQRLVDAMVSRIEARGGKVHANTPVKGIMPGAAPRLVSARGEETFDRIVATVDTATILSLLQDPSPGVTRMLAPIRWMSVTCLVLVVKKSGGAYYWLNSIDPGLAFGVLIDHTNLVPASEYGDKRILYVANYHDPDDARFGQTTPSELLDFYLPSLAKVLPGFTAGEVEHAYRFRDDRSCPVFDLGFRAKMPPYAGGIDGVDICNMAQVYPEDRNMNNCARNARRYAASFA